MRLSQRFGLALKKIWNYFSGLGQHSIICISWRFHETPMIMKYIFGASISRKLNFCHLIWWVSQLYHPNRWLRKNTNPNMCFLFQLSFSTFLSFFFLFSPILKKGQKCPYAIFHVRDGGLPVYSVLCIFLLITERLISIYKLLFVCYLMNQRAKFTAGP